MSEKRPCITNYVNWTYELKIKKKEEKPQGVRHVALLFFQIKNFYDEANEKNKKNRSDRQQSLRKIH